MKRILLIGCGEIGSAIKELEEEAGNEVFIIDIDKVAFPGAYDVMHICFPYSDKFCESIREYEKEYSAPIRIIHSTVKLGTTDQLNGYVHSPCQGAHPKIREGLMTFKKMVGGKPELAKDALEHLKSLGMTVKYAGPARVTEAAKLLDTTYYGWNIAYATKVHQYCLENNLDYEKVYKEWNTEYNVGLRKTKRSQYARPILHPCLSGLGGHCVYENAILLDYPKLTDEVIKLGKQ